MNIYTIQFSTDRRLLIPGTGSVGVRGQLLEIGPGKTGANFPYRSPTLQRQHYGEQLFVLVSVVDEYGDDVEDADIGVNLDGGPSLIDPEDASLVPDGVHEAMHRDPGTTQVTNVTNVIDEKEEKEEEKPEKKKSTRRRSISKKRDSSKKKTAKKSNSKKK